MVDEGRELSAVGGGQLAGSPVKSGYALRGMSYVFSPSSHEEEERGSR